MEATRPFEDFGDIEVIAAALDDPDPGTRRVAVMDLADTAAPEAIPYLARAIANSASEVRLQAAIALGGFDGPVVATALAGALTDADESVAHAASDSLTELKDPEAANPLFAFLTADSPFVRMSVFRGIKELRRPESLKPAVTALNDPNASVREQAVSVIGWLKLEEVVARLDQRLPRSRSRSAARGGFGARLLDERACGQRGDVSARRSRLDGAGNRSRNRWRVPRAPKPASA